MSTAARSLPADAVVAVSSASRAVGELAGLLMALPDRAVWTRRLRHAAAEGDGLDIAVECALGDATLLDAVPLRPSTTLATRLDAVAEAARCAAGAVRAADELHRDHLALAERERLGRYAGPLLTLLAEHGELTIAFAVEQIGGTPTTIGGLLDKLVAMGIIEETTGQKRNRIYRYSPFLDLFTSDDTRPMSLPVEVTQ
ncbi:MAG: hypothetical protein GX610_00025 [Rhodococcus sp.]|nr:hypothetical protein [Rhodococcus sp. (in: high G+C Gram-positive bacteria)]